MMLMMSLVVWLVWSATRWPESSQEDRRSPAEFLDERYARGEIDRDEYLQREADLEQ